MEYKTIIKEENASYNCHTITDLIDNFKVSGSFDFLKENVFNNFPADDKYDVIYDKYTILLLNEDYPVHVFHGNSVNPMESPEYTIFLDLRHSNIYYLGHSNVGNYVNCYDLQGKLLFNKDYGLKEVSIDTFVNTYLVEYRCSSIKELLTAFNLDIQLSDKLLSHEIVSDFGLVFDQHYIQEGKFGSYHVFQGYFTEMIFDAFPPIIYID